MFGDSDIRLFPVIVKRVTQVIGGDGPNPADSFSIRIIFPETNAAPTDATSFAFTFPETLGAQSDSFLAGFIFPDTVPAQSDSFGELKFVFPDSNPALSDAISLALTHGDTVATATDATSFRIFGTYGDTNAAVSDALTNLVLVHADSNGAPTDAAIFNIVGTYAETIGAVSDALGTVRISFADTVSAVSDALTALRITHSETNAAPTDSLTTLRIAWGDSAPAQTDALLTLKIGAYADSNSAPTDARSATATWIQGATTASGAATWTNPTNAQGLRNGTNSTLTDSITNTNQGTLTLDPYPDPDSSFSSWTISTVRFIFYGSGTNFTIAPANPSLFVEWSPDGSAWTTLETITANFDNSAAGNGRAYVPAAPGGSWDWTEINNLRFRFRYTTGIATVTGTVNVDAVELEVVATKNPL